MKLAGKVALVTGASQGIGHAIAQGLAAEGARIVVADLQRADEAAAGFPDCVGLTVDVSSEDDFARMAEETVERCGGIDVLVNNAGLYASLAMRPFDEIPLEEWRRVMDVNVASMFLACRAVVPRMRELGGGKIVNISSGTPFRGVPFLLHYVTRKGAIVALTRHDDEAFVQELMAAGASGYVLKQSRSTELLNAVRAVAETSQSSATSPGLGSSDSGVPHIRSTAARNGSGKDK